MNTYAQICRVAGLAAVLVGCALAAQAADAPTADAPATAAAAPAAAEPTGPAPVDSSDTTRGLDESIQGLKKQVKKIVKKPKRKIRH